MIYDTLSNLKTYTTIPYLDTILDWMQKNDMRTFHLGDTEIRGREVYVRVFEYVPEDPTVRKFETHNMYADIHIILRGIETIPTAPLPALTPLGDHDNKRDIRFYAATEHVTDMVLCENQFLFVAPGESHKPQCWYKDHREPVRKIVFKIKMG